MESPQEKIERLRRELDEHNYNYYVLNAPTIDDRTFDEMMHELQGLEKTFPQYFDPNSPTQRVGNDINRSFSQVEHRYPMLSLSNTYSIEEVSAFYERVRSGLMGEDFELVGELKYDGTSISLIYEGGRLVRAVTRGDGTRGDDVTENVKTIRSIPLQLRGNDYPDSFEIRGEILMPWAVFDALNKEREEQEEPLFANPRNAAAGTLKSQNSAVVAARGLDAYLYYLLGENLPADTHYENLQYARSWGFKVSDAVRKLHSVEEVKEYINYWDMERKNLPVATDGMVFKVNSLRQQKNLGYTAKSPRWAIAYKFQAEKALTRLDSVSYQVGRTGTVTPVANLDPVLLSGTIVKRATLHNEDIINALDLHIGDMVFVEKGGEIIPKITAVDTSARLLIGEKVRFIRTCPECGTPLKRIEGEAAWFCPNEKGCPPQIKGRIEHFISRKAMNIEGLGSETIGQFYSLGLVRDASDLYTLQPDVIAGLERMGERSAQNIVDAVKQSCSVPFERVLFALGIRYVGETVAKKLALALHSIDRIIEATTEDLIRIGDIGVRIAQSVVAYFSDEDNLRFVERLRQYGVQMQITEERLSERTDKLSGATIVISGTFTHHSRDEYKVLIEQHGGMNTGSVSGKTTYILAGENMGPAKLEKARKLGVRILSEEEFLEMIQ
ncbi:NAD-dependent DNA ligase LigA [Barnesiella intestinihominis]|uniref:NAD-dependent DNA ligase LigA n=1 Tax=Barnesiella intestinihominis TaxID=487174 RepID=UPI0018987AC3|nr:NAD-dependent DNA ligase LigA [Barnesiella intestinihominis]MDB0682650.1 NAD-dependent DNA ligase LigA [Barnesiella intestinihominis]